MMRTWNAIQNQIFFQEEVIPDDLQADQEFQIWFNLLWFSYILSLFGALITFSNAIKPVNQMFMRIFESHFLNIFNRMISPLQQLFEKVKGHLIIRKYILEQDTNQELKTPNFMVNFLCRIKNLYVLVKKIDFRHQKILEVIEQFSIIKNVSNILEVNKVSTNLDSLNGIRCICCAFVIVYHMKANFKGEAEYKHDNFQLFQVDALGMLVDIFFFISGFVNYFSLKRKYQESHGKNKFYAFVKSYIGRFLRIYPSFWFALLAGWKSNQKNPEECYNGQFLFDSSSLDKCNRPSWYIRTDFILFSFTPFCALLGNLIGNFGLAIVLLIGLNIFDISCLNLCIEKMFHVSDRYQSNDPYSKHGNILTQFNYDWRSKITVYLLGVVVSCLYLIYQEKIKNRVQRLVDVYQYPIIMFCYYIGYIQFSSALLDIIPFLYDGQQLSDLEHAEYLCEFRFRCLLGLSFIILPCILSINDPLGSVLKWKPFQIASKFTFSIYLVHLPLLFSMLRIKNIYGETVGGLIQRLIYVELWPYLKTSIILTMLVELPVSNLMRFINIS